MGSVLVDETPPCPSCGSGNTRGRAYDFAPRQPLVRCDDCHEGWQDDGAQCVICDKPGVHAHFRSEERTR